MGAGSIVEAAANRVSALIARIAAQYEVIQRLESDGEHAADATRELEEFQSALVAANQLLMQVLGERQAGERDHSGEIVKSTRPDRQFWLARAAIYLQRAMDAERKAAQGSLQFRQDMIDLAMQWRDLNRQAQEQADGLA